MQFSIVTLFLLTFGVRQDFKLQRCDAGLNPDSLCIAVAVRDSDSFRNRVLQWGDDGRQCRPVSLAICSHAAAVPTVLCPGLMIPPLLLSNAHHQSTMVEGLSTPCLERGVQQAKLHFITVIKCLSSWQSRHIATPCRTIVISTKFLDPGYRSCVPCHTTTKSM